ncbi:hypothetical protein UlMin_039107 [Ulmus minor]
MQQKLDEQATLIQNLQQQQGGHANPEGPLINNQPPLARPEPLCERFCRMRPAEVFCASYMLKKEARYWWGSVEARRDIRAMTWEDFKAEFNRKFYNPIAMQEQQTEFLTLKQGKMTVTEVVRKFEQLARLWVPPTTVADCVERAYRAEHRLMQVREERAKAFEARKKSTGPIGTRPTQAQGSRSAKPDGTTTPQGKIEMPEPTARVYAYTKRDAETGGTDVVTAAFMDLMNRIFREYLDKFVILKRRLTSAPILIVPSEDEEFTIYCDASKMGLGARRWLELVKDYDCEILYHPGKANRVADALSRRTPAALMSIQALPKALQEDVQKLELELIMGQMSTLTLQPTIFEGMKGSQELDPDLMRIREKVTSRENSEFGLSPDGIYTSKGDCAYRMTQK